MSVLPWALSMAVAVAVGCGAPPSDDAASGATPSTVVPEGPTVVDTDALVVVQVPDVQAATAAVMTVVHESNGTHVASGADGARMIVSFRVPGADIATVVDRLDAQGDVLRVAGELAGDHERRVAIVIVPPGES